MIGIVVATQTYASSRQSYTLSSEKIAASISALLVVGSVSATLLSDSTDWWYKHFSAIGATANLFIYLQLICCDKWCYADLSCRYARL